jgi:hypothetical protein
MYSCALLHGSLLAIDLSLQSWAVGCDVNVRARPPEGWR